MDTLIEPWEDKEIVISAMKFPIKTKNSITGKKCIKKDEQGATLFVEKIIPKERPRFSTVGKFVKTHSAPNTVAFEKHIRKCYFTKYSSGQAVKTPKGIEQVGTQYLGCKLLNETKPCTLFLQDKDFKNCKKCKQRRKNLSINVKVFLKDSRHLDLDNILKIVLDALEHTFFYNDSQFVKKHIVLIPYAETERIECKFSVLPPVFEDYVLKNAYSIKDLKIDEALTYITWLSKHITISEFFLSCIKRMDIRAKVTNLVEHLRGTNE